MTTTNETKQKESTSLVYKTDKIVGKEHIFVTIRLDDKCKNGHQDFAITANIYEAGKPKTDRYFISGGCCHEDIVKAYPEFKQFVDLHLCDYLGTPGYPVANGFYFLTEGFNKEKPTDNDFADKFCEYFRITADQYRILKDAKNKVQFGLRLENMNVRDQWQRDAKTAIATLEELTDTKFIVDSRKTQWDGITKEQIAEEEQRVKNGYYTPEAEAQREEEKTQKEIAKLEADRDKDIKKAVDEFEVKKAVLLAGGAKALGNCIFYTHTNTLAFNWMSYGQLPDSFIEEISKKIELPEGVKMENKHK